MPYLPCRSQAWLDSNFPTCHVVRATDVPTLGATLSPRVTESAPRGCTEPTCALPTVLGGISCSAMIYLQLAGIRCSLECKTKPPRLKKQPQINYFSRSHPCSARPKSKASCGKFPILLWQSLHTQSRFFSSRIDPPCDRRIFSWTS